MFRNIKIRGKEDTKSGFSGEILGPFKPAGLAV